VKGGRWKPLGSDKRKALEEHARLVTQPKGGMAELIDEAMPHILKGCAKGTQEQYMKGARKLKEVFAEFAPQEVLPKDVAKFKRTLASTPNATNRCITVFRMIFDYAVEEQIADSNPCVGIKRLEEGKRDRLIAPDEFQKIRAHVSPRMQCMMDIAYLSGQRIMDVVKLPLSKILADGLEFKAQKTGKKIVVEWTPELRQAVDNALALHNHTRKIKATTLFFSKWGTPPTYKVVYYQWMEGCKLAGVEDANMHDIRAMAATAAEEQGMNPTALLDHSSPQNTKRYLRGRKTKHVQGPKF
jgi:integrase